MLTLAKTHTNFEHLQLTAIASARFLASGVDHCLEGFDDVSLTLVVEQLHW